MCIIIWICTLDIYRWKIRLQHWHTTNVTPLPIWVFLKFINKKIYLSNLNLITVVVNHEIWDVSNFVKVSLIELMIPKQCKKYTISLIISRSFLNPWSDILISRATYRRQEVDDKAISDKYFDISFTSSSHSPSAFNFFSFKSPLLLT